MENDIETTIWKYIDLGKFVSLLVSESLYFACPCEFEDPYEGLVPKSHVEAESAMIQKYIDPLLSFREKLTAEATNTNYLALFDNALNDFAKMVKSSHKAATLCFGVSCWHKSECESEAMWKLYSGHAHGIAIKSTIRQLQRSLKNAKNVIIDNVRYTDFDNDPIEKGHKHYGLFLKRKSFEHEKEIRATILLPQAGRGILVPCDIDTLISQVHLSPFAPVYLKNAVETICSGKLRMLQKPVIQSKLFDAPDYGIKINVET
jgi:hypothetical protein